MDFATPVHVDNCDEHMYQYVILEPILDMKCFTLYLCPTRMCAGCNMVCDNDIKIKLPCPCIFLIVLLFSRQANIVLTSSSDIHSIVLCVRLIRN